MRWPIRIAEKTRSDTRPSGPALSCGTGVAAHPVAQLNEQVTLARTLRQTSHRSHLPRTRTFHTIYDGEGKRIKKIVGGETTVFVYSDGKLIAEYATEAPAETGTTSYTITDQLGSPRIIVDGLGQVVSRRDFMPFGEEIAVDGTYRTTTKKYGETDNVRQKFTGYQKDEETGLDFAEARMYENRHGRFTAVDPLLASGKSADPQTFNRYVYVLNNPLMLTDPDGLQSGTDPNQRKSAIKDYKIRVDGTNKITKSSSELNGKESRTLGFKDNNQGGFLNMNVDVIFNEGANPSDYSSERTVIFKASMPNAPIGQQETIEGRGGTLENPQKSETVVEGQTKTIQDNPGASTAVPTETGARIIQPKNAIAEGTFTAFFIEGERNKQTKQLDSNVLFYGVQIKYDKKGNIDPSQSGIQRLSRDEFIKITNKNKPEELLSK